MKLTIQKSELAQALAAVSAVVSSRNSLPYLQMVKLEALDAGAISVTATDMECFYTRILNAEIGQPGSCLVPAARIKEWLGIVSGEITLQTVENHIKLTSSGGGTIKFSTIESEKFPKLPETTASPIATADFAPLKHITPAIIGSNEGRPQLEAVFIESDVDGLIGASTNGRQVATVAIKAKVGQFAPVALPSKYVSIVAGLGECEMSESKNDLHLANKTTMLSVRKTEHGVPNWRRAVYNEQFPIVGSITVMREEFVQAVAQCHVHRGNELGSEWGVRVGFGKTESGMNISCFVNKTGDSYSHDIDGRIKGEFPPVILSTEYLTPFLQLPDESPLKIEFTGSKTMVHMNAADLNVDYYFSPMMPLEEKA
jgi:DNA polymerase-3 subunit beta